MKDEKQGVFASVRKLIEDSNLTIVYEDQSRPWGGFFVLSEDQIERFIKLHFSQLDKSTFQVTNKLSPKILVVAPACRLSWQYHHRRGEFWTVLKGPVEVAISDTDQEREVVTLKEGETIKLLQGQRHRLIGTDDWGVVAEIWQHTVADMPSDENDIVRVQDDFGR